MQLVGFLGKAFSSLLFEKEYRHVSPWKCCVLLCFLAYVFAHFLSVSMSYKKFSCCVSEHLSSSSFYLDLNSISETGFCLPLWVALTQITATDKANPSPTPASTLDMIHEPSTV
jgi:hypothetical protein